MPGTSEFSTGFVGTSGLNPRWVLRLRKEGLLQPSHEAPGPRHVMGQVLEGVGQR